MNHVKTAIRAFIEERDWDQFHSPKNLAVAISVESAELLEHFQWIKESESYELNEKKLEAVSEEIADVFILLQTLCEKLDLDLFTAVQEKLIKTAKKYPVALCKGKSTKYTEYQT